MLAAKAGTFRHAALGPRGAPPVPDPRLLEWAIPETCKPEGRVCLAYSTARDVRQTYLAQAWREPRSFTTRYKALLDGLTTQERRARLARVAAALTHPAIPEEERHHLYVTMHHGHWQGGNKGKGDQRLTSSPPPPPFPGLLPNPQVTLPSTSPPLSILGRGFPLCRCVEHTPL